MYGGERHFGQFIEELTSRNNFDWFVTLGYVPERHIKPSPERRKWEKFLAEAHPEDRGVRWHKTPATGGECLESWLEKIQEPPYRGPGVSDYLYMVEYRRDILRRRDQQTLFHVFIADWRGCQDSWEHRWKEISGGWAKTKVLDDRINGFIGHLVMRKGCGLSVASGRHRGWYTKLDFVPWREK